MPTQIFDAGYLFGIQNGQPVKFGVMQGIEAQLDFDLLPMRPPTVGPIGMILNGFSMKFKAKTAQINGLLFNQLYMGQSLSTGSQAVARDVTFNVPATGPYTYTPAPPSSGTFATDLGVQYASTGEPLAWVASGPAQGQYSVSGGVYTFAAADQGAAMVVNYLYSLSTGNSLALANNFKQVQTIWRGLLNTLYDGKQVTWNLPACVSRQLVVVTEVNKFAIPNFSFEAIPDQTPPLGNFGTFSFSD